MTIRRISLSKAAEPKEPLASGLIHSLGHEMGKHLAKNSIRRSGHGDKPIPQAECHRHIEAAKASFKEHKKNVDDNFGGPASHQIYGDHPVWDTHRAVVNHDNWRHAAAYKEGVHQGAQHALDHHNAQIEISRRFGDK